MFNEDFQEYMIQSNALMGQENYEEAIKYLNKAEQIDNLNIDVYLTKGLAYANLEKYEEAKLEFEKVLKINKSNGIACFHLGNIEIFNGNRGRAVELYNNAIANGFDDAQVYFSLGLMHEEDDEDELAVRNYSKAIKKDPNRADIRVRKVRLLIQNNMLQEALQSLDELILSNPDVFEGYHLKFLVLVSLNELEKAEKVIEEAMELFPADSAFAMDKASLLITKKMYDEALEYLEMIKIEMETDSTIERSIAMEKSRIYAFLQDMDKTIESLEEAKGISEKMGSIDVEATYLLMNCYLAEKDYHKVIEHAKALKKLEGEDYYSLSAHYYEPFALKMLGEEEKANELFEESITYYRGESLKYPNNVDAYAFRIMSLRELGKYDKALELADYLVTVSKDLAESHALRASVLDAMGRTDEADDERRLAKSLGGMMSNV